MTPPQNTFAIVTCNEEAGAAPYITRRVSRSLAPRWDEAAAFAEVEAAANSPIVLGEVPSQQVRSTDQQQQYTLSSAQVSPADCLRVSILDRRLMGPHLLLGQASQFLFLARFHHLLTGSCGHRPLPENCPVSHGARWRATYAASRHVSGCWDARTVPRVVRHVMLSVL